MVVDEWLINGRAWRIRLDDGPVVERQDLAWPGEWSVASGPRAFDAVVHRVIQLRVAGARA